jgi:uncharacterized protein (TIGR02466 family)
MILNFFGPPIYHTAMSEEHLSMLKDIANKSVDSESVGYGLAGNIQTQNEAVVDDKAAFLKFVEYHIIQFCDQVNKGGEAFTYHLGPGPWINYMKQHEFNPLHVHDGTLSVVAFIDVPEEIDNEREQWVDKTNTFSAGMLEFIHSKSMFSPGYAKVIPQTGDLYMFPGDLAHCVYPFKSDVTRISMSFNIFDLQFT